MCVWLGIGSINYTKHLQSATVFINSIIFFSLLDRRMHSKYVPFRSPTELRIDLSFISTHSLSVLYYILSSWQSFTLVSCNFCIHLVFHLVNSIFSVDKKKSISVWSFIIPNLASLATVKPIRRLPSMISDTWNKWSLVEKEIKIIPKTTGVPERPKMKSFRWSTKIYANCTHCS